MSETVEEVCADGRTRVFNRAGEVIEEKPLSIFEVIKRAELAPRPFIEKPDLGRVIGWLSELRRLRREVKHLKATLAETREKLLRFQREVPFELDNDVRITLSISHMGKGWKTVAVIDGYAFVRLRADGALWNIKEAVERVTEEAMQGFLVETGR